MSEIERLLKKRQHKSRECPTIWNTSLVHQKFQISLLQNMRELDMSMKISL